MLFLCTKDRTPVHVSHMNPDDVPWMELIDPLWAKILKLVKETWMQGDTHQDMDPDIDYRHVFIPIVLQGDTRTGWMVQGHSWPAPCNEHFSTISADPSQTLTTCLLAIRDDSVDDDGVIANWWTSLHAIFTMSSDFSFLFHLSS